MYISGISSRALSSTILELALINLKNNTHHVLILTDQKEVLRFPHNEKEALEMHLEIHALIPKSESSFLVTNRKQQINRNFELLVFSNVSGLYKS